MNLRETKLYFETLFNSFWTGTPIHYAGMEFDGTKHVSWINPVYKPLRSTSNGVSGNTSVELGQLYVVCWADYDSDAMKLSDDVVDFLKTNINKAQFRSRGYEIIDHGWDESNKVFIMLSFTYEQLSGSC